jgi:uncharacterized protein YecT (DUF1311 family)
VKPTRIVTVIAVGALFGSPSGPARADEQTDQRAIQARELRVWDDRLNEVYGNIRAILDEQQRRDLQEAQRAWLRWRNSECHTNGGAERDAWIAAVAADNGVWGCVYSATLYRVTELRRELDGAQDPKYPSRVNPYSRLQKWLTLTHSTGKWYFEVTADIGAIARLQPTDLYAGFVVDGHVLGTGGSIRAGDSSQGVQVYGLALDLDEGRYYVAVNGIWQGAAPGSAAGAVVTLGKSYGATVGTREGTNKLLLANALVPRFGSEPFVYPIPTGYRAWRDLTCVAPQNSREVAMCLGDELRAADEQINREYQALQAALDAQRAQALRNEQRDWITRRDTECAIPRSRGDRDIWYRSVLENGERTLCVVRLTRARNAELRLRSTGTPASTAIPENRADFLVSPPFKLNAGRWYYEIVLYPAKLGPLPSVDVSIGCGENDTGTAAMHIFRASNVGSGTDPLPIGIAVDFDAGKLFTNNSGVWVDGPPTGGGGLSVKAKTPYNCGAYSTTSLIDLKTRGVLEARFGDTAPFLLPVPDGFRAIASGRP